MRHIHTSIVSRHLATRGNNKILRTHPPHISSSEERLPRITRHTLAQIRTNKSPFIKSYIHKVDAKITSITNMPPLQHQHNRHTPSLQLHPHTHPTVTPRFVDRPRWLVDQKRDDRTPPHKQWSREWVDTHTQSEQKMASNQLPKKRKDLAYHHSASNITPYTIWKIPS